MVEMSRFGGKVLDGDGEPVGDAWVIVPDLGIWTSSDRQGRFILDRLSPGEYKLRVRTVDGGETEVNVQVPGSTTDIVIGAPAKKSSAGASRKTK
jgi:hypothetical protein